MDPNVDITFFLTLTKFLSLTGLIDSSYVDRNNHLLNVVFAVLVYGGFRALLPLASSQHPLFWSKSFILDLNLPLDLILLLGQFFSFMAFGLIQP